MELKGRELLLSLYKLPILPYDFASAPVSYSISHVFRMITDVDSPAVLSSILDELIKSYHEAKVFLTYEGHDSILAKFVDLRGNLAAKIDVC
jgi:hypothetical protein